MSVCLLGTQVSCAELAEFIEMLLEGGAGVVICVGLTKEPCLRQRSRSPMGRGQIRGSPGPLRSIANHCCGLDSKRDHQLSITAARSRRDHFILNNGMTAGLRQPTAMLPTGQCRIILSRCENLAPPPRCGLLSQNSLTTGCCGCCY